MTGFSDAGFYRFAADVRNEVTGATLTEVFKEIDKMRAEGSDGAELQGAKSYLRGIFPIQTATQTGLAATLNNVYVYGRTIPRHSAHGSRRSRPSRSRARRRRCWDPRTRWSRSSETTPR